MHNKLVKYVDFGTEERKDHGARSSELGGGLYRVFEIPLKLNGEVARGRHCSGLVVCGFTEYKDIRTLVRIRCPRTKPRALVTGNVAV